MLLPRGVEVPVLELVNMTLFGNKAFACGFREKKIKLLDWIVIQYD